MNDVLYGYHSVCIFNVRIRWHFTIRVPCGILTVRDGKFEFRYLMVDGGIDKVNTSFFI